MSTVPQVSLTAEQITQYVKDVANNKPGHKGFALRQLREAAGLTQRDLATRFHRQHSCVAGWESEKSWPPGHMALRVLETLNVPASVLVEHFDIQLDGDLDPRAYLAGDYVEIEYLYFLRNRGQVLQAVTSRAKEGSTADAKLFTEWMERINREHDARETKTRTVTEPEAEQARSTWTRAALKSGTPTGSGEAVIAAALPEHESVTVDNKENAE